MIHPLPVPERIRPAATRTAVMLCLALTGLLPVTAGLSAPADGALRADAAAALKRAATYFRTHAASHGGYVYYCSLDFRQRWGEGAATPDQIFVEPPGTPAVGCAYLAAYDATGDRYYLNAAKETATALIHGQLESGGWSQRIDFDPNGSHAARYRNGRGRIDGFNVSSLDDNQTQSSIQFLARLDRALRFQDPAVHAAAMYALGTLLQAQFPVGAFPQGWKQPVAEYPGRKASYPKEWLRVWPHEEYYRYYTLNDGLTGTVSDTLLTALEVYQDDRYRAALAKLGDFLILAQMPEPQPAWCQQYDFEMQPTWARKFEPPAICGFESEDAMRTLMKVYRATRERKYLEPIPRALAYLRQCRLPDGRMARYYELRTNRPLYMTRPPGVSGNSNAPGYYEFSYSDDNLPGHYGWKQRPQLDELKRELAAVEREKPGPARVVPWFTPIGKLVTVDPAAPGAAPSPAELEPQVRRIVQELDAEGRWVTVHDRDARLVGQPRFEPGFRYLASNVFNYNVGILSQYLAASRPR